MHEVYIAFKYIQLIYTYLAKKILRRQVAEFRGGAPHIYSSPPLPGAPSWRSFACGNRALAKHLSENAVACA